LFNLGLEPTLVHCTWHPKPNPLSKRQAHGCFWLRNKPKITEEMRLNLPHIVGNSLKPLPFHVGAVEAMNKCCEEVRKWFSGDQKIVKEWRNWKIGYVPLDNDVIKYVTQTNLHAYNQPLRELLFDEGVAYRSILTNPNSTDISTDDNIQLVAVATASVAWHFDHTPPPPRIVLTNNDALNSLVASYRTTVYPFYEEASKLSDAQLHFVSKGKPTLSY